MELSIEPKTPTSLAASEMVANGAAAAASMRRRRAGGGGGRRSEGGASSTMLQFYTEETPGLRLSPIVVLIMSIGFIAFVGILHVLGKLYLVPRSS